MKPSNIITACLFAFVVAIGLFIFSDLYQEAGPAAIPPQAVAPTAITTEEAISYIEQGQAILDMALQAFNDQPSRVMGSALLQITDEFNQMLGGLCQIEGTGTSCAAAQNIVVQSYTVLFEYAKELEAQP